MIKLWKYNIQYISSETILSLFSLPVLKSVYNLLKKIIPMVIGWLYVKINGEIQN